MTMLQVNTESNPSNQMIESNHEDPGSSEISKLSTYPRRVALGEHRPLSPHEADIIQLINNCFQNWYQPWRKTFLEGGEEFQAVYDLMENLMHYENQILTSETTISPDRAKAIAQAVVRLIDYGNGILNLDLIIRVNDDTSRELDPTKATTIELYHAHIKAQKLRIKLLHNYFRQDKRNLLATTSDSDLSQLGSSMNLVTNHTLHVPFIASNNPSPTMERSHRIMQGSSSSINTLVADSGRRTPSTPIHLEIKTSPHLSCEDLSSSQLEMRHMIATVKSDTFSAPQNTSTRMTLLPGVLAKIESLLTVPSNLEKLTNCFDLLDTLLNAIERLPAESRREEVNIIAISLLEPILRKVYTDTQEKIVEFQHSHWTTYLLSMIRLMTSSDFSAYLKHFTKPTDLSAFLKDYLFIIKRLVTQSGSRHHSMDHQSVIGTVDIENSNDELAPTYPQCWIEMSLLVSSVFLGSLTHLYQVIKNQFSSNLQMWSSFIDCLVHFMLQDSLRPERSMFKERQYLLAHDMRKISAEYVWIAWDSLNYDQKQCIIEDLIGPLLRACMILKSRQRAILLPIFYDMMRCDYTSQYMTPRGSACNSSGSLLSQLDRLEPLSPSNLIYEEDIDDFPQIELNSPEFLGQSPQISISCAINSNGQQQTNHREEYLPHLSYQKRNTSNEDGTVLTRFTHLIIGKFNELMVELGLGDEQFKAEFCQAISGMDSDPRYFQSSSSSLLVNSGMDMSQFKSMARHTSDLIAEFIQICLDSRQANKLSYNHLHLLCLFKLILFFRDKVDRLELYLTYLHKLWSLHHQVGRYVEAGFTLLEHARTLPWSGEPLDHQYRIITRSFQSAEQLNTYISLKTFLYKTIIEYFDQGQLWEAAVPLCRELIDFYQYKTFEYVKLAEIYAKLAVYFGNISEPGLRSHPEYFRVTFYGCGFPKCLQNVTMIYRGKPYEKLGDFQATLSSKYPDAKLMTTLSKPDESLLNEPDSKYMQINACSPIVNIKSKIDSSLIDLAKIDTPILDYYKHNDCDKFEFSRRLHIAPATPIAAHNGDDFANMWRERTTLTTNSLPGMLPFFPVYLNETNIISPIECAIEDLERVNDRLSCMVNRFKADKRQVEDVRLLGQLLLGIVDAAVNGGITKYEKAFFYQPQQQHQHQQNINGGQVSGPSSSSTSASPASSSTSSAASLSPSISSDGGNVGGGGNAAAAAAAASTTMESNSAGATKSTTNKSSTAVEITERNNKQTGNHIGQQQTYVTMPQPARPREVVNQHGGQQEQPRHRQQHHRQELVDKCNHPGANVSAVGAQPSASQLNKLKCLIAHQVPLLDEAIRLHRDRVADVMRPQHEHLEASYKNLKHHIMSKYSRWLPAEYNRSTATRSFRSLARSPNRSIRSESSRLQVDSTAAHANSSSPSRFKRNSDAGRSVFQQRNDVIVGGADDDDGGASRGSNAAATNIPYKQMARERRSLPFLTGVPGFDQYLIKEVNQRDKSPKLPRRQGGFGNSPTIATNNENLSTPPPPPPPSRTNNSTKRPAIYDDIQAALPRTAAATHNSDYVCISDIMAKSSSRSSIAKESSSPYERLLPDKNSRQKDLNGGSESDDANEDTKDDGISSSEQISEEKETNKLVLI